MTSLQSINEELEQRIAAAAEQLGYDASRHKPIEVSFSDRDSKFGDLQTSAAMQLSKEFGMKPRELATLLASSFGDIPYINDINVAGPGFINFKIDWDAFSKDVLEEIIQNKGYVLPPQSGRYLVEHTSVNPNKEWHIGHVRNAVLGDTVVRILSSLGYKVQAQNYIDDTGKQVVDSILGLRDENLSLSDLKGKIDHAVGEVYVSINEKYGGKIPNNDELMHEVEQGKYRTLIEAVVKAQLQTAFKLGIRYDILIWESDVVGAGLFEEAMNRIKKTEHVFFVDENNPLWVDPQNLPALDSKHPLAYKWKKEGDQRIENFNGCLVMDMTDFVQGDDQRIKILIRSNDAPVYVAKDIALQMWKFGLLEKDMAYTGFMKQPDGSILLTSHPNGNLKRKFKDIDGVVNVIGAEQAYEQKTVYAGLAVTGHKEQFEHSHHLAYAFLNLPEGRMSGRKGITVSADEVVALLTEKAGEEIRKRGNVDKGKINETAENIAIGAIRYATLSTNPESEITFDMKRSLEMTGNTGVYLQYAGIRMNAILAKSNYNASDNTDFSLIDSDVERDLIRKIAFFPTQVTRAATNYNPAVLAGYAYELANSFNSFYAKENVLKSETPELRQARLGLVYAAQTVLYQTLDLLGIPKLEQM
jgi:arginyl-tRNA synthetase